MKKVFFTMIVLLGICLSFPNSVEARTRPKLIVQVVVDGIRYDNFVRFSQNYTSEGFGKFAAEGTQYRNARHDNVTSYPFVGVASIVTGSTPSQHGVIGKSWINYTTNNSIDMFADYSCVGVGTLTERGAFSPKNLIVQSVGDLLRNDNDSSKIISIAHDYRNAIVAGGSNPSAVYWLDTMNMWWASNSYYMQMLPKWCETFNRGEFPKAICNKGWVAQKSQPLYINNRSKSLFAKDKTSILDIFKTKTSSYDQIHATPLVDDYLFEMARQTILGEKLGTDQYPDLLTISLSGLSQINEKYGVNSVEAEDAFYNLDRLMGELNNLLTLKCGKGNFVILFTGSCGSSNDIVIGERSRSGQFNKMQFKVMMNSFLAAQFGVYDLIMSYDKGNVFLNRKLVFEKQLSLREVREKCATFALQFKGVAHTYTSDALSYMGAIRGVQGRVVNSIYPKYSGDVVLVLLPNWFEVELENSKVVSTYGSGYDYDVHVPLMFYGAGIAKRDVVGEVSVIDIAPTICELLRIGRTDVSQGVALSEIVSVSL